MTSYVVTPQKDVKTDITEAVAGKVVLPPHTDINIVKKFHKEFFWRHFPKVTYLKLDRENTIVDTLTNETTNWVYHDPIEIPAYVKLSPSRQLLGLFGIDEERDLLIAFSVAILHELGLGNNAICIGDKVIYDNIEYQIMTVHRRNYFFNWNIPLEITCTLSRFRRGV